MDKDIVLIMDIAQALQGQQRMQTILTMKVSLETNAHLYLMIQIGKIRIISVMV